MPLPQAGNQPSASALSDIQQSAGIKTQILQTDQKQAEIAASGMVLSLEPLLILRQHYLAAKAQQDGVKARFQEAELNLARTRNLHQNDIVSTRRLQEQQTRWQQDKANLNSSGAEQQALVSTSRMHWGDILTNWFILGQGKQADPFLHHRAQLLEIILPAGQLIKPGLTQLAVDILGQRDHAQTARLIGPAPTIEPVSQGMRYFFAIQGEPYPIGARLHVWVALDTAETVGVFLPQEAVVWYLGRPSVFVKSTQDVFKRRPLRGLIAVQSGYRVSGELQPGDEVAVTGAQTLLSEELNQQIPEEDDD